MLCLLNASITQSVNSKLAAAGKFPYISISPAASACYAGSRLLMRTRVLRFEALAFPRGKATRKHCLGERLCAILLGSGYPAIAGKMVGGLSPILAFRANARRYQVRALEEPNCGKRFHFRRSFSVFRRGFPATKSNVSEPRQPRAD